MADMDKMIDRLLKSSLVLEHQVSSIAADSGYHNQGEFSYSRKNEVDHESDFSIDLLTAVDFSGNHNVGAGKSLNVLIESKYSSPSVEWIFSKTTNHNPQVFSAFSVFNWLADYLARDFSGMKGLEPEAYCSRGVSLSTSSADPKQIRHGIQQLRHALPNLLYSTCIIYKDDISEMPIPVLASILVTNAPLRVLKDGVCISQVEACKSLDEITTLHNHINVYQLASPELKLACNSVSRMLGEELSKKPHFNLQAALAEELIDAVESVTVISLSALPDYLKKLREIVEDIDVISVSDFMKEYGKFISD